MIRAFVAIQKTSRDSLAFSLFELQQQQKSKQRNLVFGFQSTADVMKQTNIKEIALMNS